MSHALNMIDYAIIALVLLSAIVGVFRGFVREMISVIFWVASFYLAIRFTPQVSQWFAPHVHSTAVANAISFAAIMIAVLLFGIIVNVLFGFLVDKAGIGAVDRFVGLLFGVARGIIVVAILILMFNFTRLADSQQFKQSSLLPSFKPLVTWMYQYLPEKVQKMSQQMQVKPKGDIKLS